MDERFNELLDAAEFDGSPCGETVLVILTSAVSLIRLQFEALTHAMWFIYASPR